MGKNSTKLQTAQKEAEKAVNETNKKISELGDYTGRLYDALTTIQGLFDQIRNVPEKNRLKYKDLEKVRLNWKKQAEKIEADYKKTEIKAAGQGVAGVGAGVAVVALGPTAAMGVATTFGVASTGTAISALSGAAATNAALAWLGGGALAAGGGGIAAGNALLAMAGPVGWAVAGIAVVTSGIFFLKSQSDKHRLEDIYTLISERDVKSYNLAIVELNERIRRIVDESEKLNEAVERIKTFGIDYKQMTERQQFELGAYVNLMESSTMLLVNPILGLQPKYTEQDFKELCETADGIYRKYFEIHEKMIISLANLLYKIPLDEKDKNILSKSLQRNKEYLDSIGMEKSNFGAESILMVEKALAHRYRSRPY